MGGDLRRAVSERSVSNVRHRRVAVRVIRFGGIFRRVKTMARIGSGPPNRAKDSCMPNTPKQRQVLNRRPLEKCPTGIKGFDEITEGGLPRNRISLFSGSTGTGKTLLGLDFLIKGATEYNERGVFMSFEETEDELYKDVASLNLDSQRLVSRKQIALEHVRLERKDIHESGDFNLEGLFIRLEHAIDSISAKRVVLDSIESLFAG